jgi:two-component system response regulator DesR
MCVDDNRLVAEAVELRLRSEPNVEWAGWLSDTDDLLSGIEQAKPDVLLLDVDMPGHDAFGLLRELNARIPGVRTVMFSGYVRSDYIDRAIAAGAWGYVSKNEAFDELLAAIHQVTAGEFALSGDVTLQHLNAH